MRVAITNITGGGMSYGYRKYLCNIIPRIAAHPDVEAILCASPASINVKDWFHLLPNVNFINCRQFRFFRYFPDQDLKLQLEKFSPDVIFVPVERYFCFNDAPVVNMIQNMEPFVTDINGNPVVERFKTFVRAFEGKRSVKKANRVIAVSKFVYNLLIQKWKIQPEKISLIYHGINLHKNNDCNRPNIIPKGWNGKFLFTAGSIRPARGLEDLIYAFSYLHRDLSEISGLVIAGEITAGMNKYKRFLDKLIQANNMTNKICWAGNLNEQEMSWCYQNCRAFVMTSRVESFGMIAGEAMSYGCICISADNPCLPENFGDAAIYYPPKNGKDLSEIIRTVLSWDEAKRNQMCEKARKRASEFSWDICAQRTVAELKKAIETFKQKN